MSHCGRMAGVGLGAELRVARSLPCHSAQARAEGVASCSTGPSELRPVRCLRGRQQAVSLKHGPSRKHHRILLPPISAAAGSKGAVEAQQLPIFPLSVVALPAATVPLNIFEARYRVLFSTLLAGSEGLEDGLVNEESPFAGTRKFGMCYFDQEGRLATIGTVLYIDQFVKLEDGRLLITTKGQQRFRIRKVAQERPVLVCDVELLSELDGEDEEEMAQLADELRGLFQDTMVLNLKMRKTQAPPEVAVPKEVTTLSPRDLSFWVASLFGDSPLVQQQLLEEDSAIQRLKREVEILAGTVKYLRATNAVESAFAPSTSGEPGSPPQGGPD